MNIFRSVEAGCIGLLSILYLILDQHKITVFHLRCIEVRFVDKNFYRCSSKSIFRHIRQLDINYAATVLGCPPKFFNDVLIWR